MFAILRNLYFLFRDQTTSNCRNGKEEIVENNESVLQKSEKSIHKLIATNNEMVRYLMSDPRKQKYME